MANHLPEAAEWLSAGPAASIMLMATHTTSRSLNELLRGRRAVSPEMALRLSRLFGNTPSSA